MSTSKRNRKSPVLANLAQDIPEMEAPTKVRKPRARRASNVQLFKQAPTLMIGPHLIEYCSFDVEFQCDAHVKAYHMREARRVAYEEAGRQLRRTGDYLVAEVARAFVAAS